MCSVNVCIIVEFARGNGGNQVKMKIVLSIKVKITIYGRD